jgi:hypothetical protein
MSDELKKPEHTDVTEEGALFVRDTLASVPAGARAFIGTIVGSAAAIWLVVVFTGMQGPVTRVANAYAQRLETSANQLDKTSTTLSEQVKILAGIVERLNALETRTSDMMKVDLDHERRITILEGGRDRTRPK